MPKSKGFLFITWRKQLTITLEEESQGFSKLAIFHH